MAFDVSDLLGYRLLQQAKQREIQKRADDEAWANRVAEQQRFDEAKKEAEFNRRLKVAELVGQQDQALGKRGRYEDPRLQEMYRLGRGGRQVFETDTNNKTARDLIAAKQKSEAEMALKKEQLGSEEYIKSNELLNRNNESALQRKHEKELQLLRNAGMLGAARERGASGPTGSSKPSAAAINAIKGLSPQWRRYEGLLSERQRVQNSFDTSGNKEKRLAEIDAEMQKLAPALKAYNQQLTPLIRAFGVDITDFEPGVEQVPLGGATEQPSAPGSSSPEEDPTEAALREIGLGR